MRTTLSGIIEGPIKDPDLFRLLAAVGKSVIWRSEPAEFRTQPIGAYVVIRQLGRSQLPLFILSVVHAFGADYNRASRDTRMILPAKFRRIFLPVLLAPIAAFAHHAY